MPHVILIELRALAFVPGLPHVIQIESGGPAAGVKEVAWQHAPAEEAGREAGEVNGDVLCRACENGFDGVKPRFLMPWPTACS